MARLPSFRPRGKMGFVRPGTTDVHSTPEFLRWLDQAILQSNTTAASAESAGEVASAAPVGVYGAFLSSGPAPVSVETSKTDLAPVFGGCEAIQELPPV